eukprot:gene28724-37965_t
MYTFPAVAIPQEETFFYPELDSGWLLRRGSPLPIPNREVKPACADGTAICGRVCRRLSLWNPSLKKLGFFFLCTTCSQARFVAFFAETLHHSMRGLSSCSNEENKTLNEAASRPRVPILSNEVRIGTQVWMSKNLNVSKYRNGDVIPQVTDPTQWANLTTGAWCYNSNNTANGIVYGKLYNWYAVDDPRGLAPVGGGSVAGGKMKATILWINPNTEATNDTGFTGLPAGYRGDNASF